MNKHHLLNPLGPVLTLFVLVGAGCQLAPLPGTPSARSGDEIIVASQLVHTGTRVITWLDPGGYDAYRVERRFAPLDESSWEASEKAVLALKSPNRYGLRREGLMPEQVEKVRGGGWDLPLLRDVVDQFVLHFDACGTSRQCFRILHDMRCLSVHFMLDVDGTIYQTLDLKERAWHATSSNTRSIGIEIAHIGAYPAGRKSPLDDWYQVGTDNRVRLRIPERLGDGGIRTRGFVSRPARPDRITGVVQGRQLDQFDFTPEQYDALVKLTATLCKTFPRIKCDYPKAADGKLITQKLPDAELARFQGVLGHFHIQTNKVDPGPAFQWDYVIDGARKLLPNQRQPSRSSGLTRR